MCCLRKLPLRISSWKDWNWNSTHPSLPKLGKDMEYCRAQKSIYASIWKGHFFFKLTEWNTHTIATTEWVSQWSRCIGQFITPSISFNKAETCSCHFFIFLQNQEWKNQNQLQDGLLEPWLWCWLCVCWTNHQRCCCLRVIRTTMISIS